MTTPTDSRSAGPSGMAPTERRVPLEPGFREYLWNRAWALLAFAALLPATAVAVIAAPGWPLRGVILALAVILAGWHAWWVLKHPQWWERALLPMAVYFAGAVVLLAALRWCAEIFSLAILGFFPMAFVALPGVWSYPAAAVLSMLTVQGGIASLWRGTFALGDLLFPLGAAVLVSVIGAMTRQIEREAIRRRETNAELVELAAENAALQARLVEQARQSGVSAERARLARDIHDTVAQGLAGIVTQLETAEAQAAPDETVRRLRIARDLARDSLVEVRRSVTALRPAILDDADLAQALEREVDAWRHRNGVAATLTVTGTPGAVDAAADETLLRVAQEAMSNAARHADANRLGVTLSYMEDMLVLDVRDDGRGFAVDRAEGPGFGLTAMRQRVRELGGSLHVESSPGSGTAVSVSVPVGEDLR